MNNRTLLVTVLTLVFVISIVGVGLQSAAVRNAPVQVAQSSSKAQLSASGAIIPFELINKHIVLALKVNNSRPLSFVLDTGDQFAIINLDRAKELKLKLRGQVSVGGAGASTQRGAFVDGASYTISGLPGFSQPVTMALPLGGLSSRFGQDFDGIIGSEFIRQFIVEIDYQARVLKLHDKEKFVYEGTGESIPIQLVHGHPFLDAEVTPSGRQPIKGRFVLDIGASLALALYSPFVAEHGLLNSNLKTIKSIGGAGAGGKTTGKFGRVDQLKFGSFKIRHPITLFSEDKAGAFASSSLAGNIGARVASKFRLFLDYSRSRIIFEPNDTFGDPYDQAFSGAAIVAEGPNYRTFRIMDLLENSPAAEAGLQKEDIIAAINGQPAAEFTLSKLNEMFEQPIAYKLSVRRGEQTLQVTLTPKRLV
jgi:Aspartyl protease/PDZ domain